MFRALDRLNRLVIQKNKITFLDWIYDYYANVTAIFCAENPFKRLKIAINLFRIYSS